VHVEHRNGAASSVAAPRRGWLAAALSTLRPAQWIKNGLVVAAAGAAGALGRDDVPLRVGLAFFAFCLLSGGIYAINDVRDAEEDRLHPRKRTRAVPAGEISERAAIGLGAACMLGGLALCAAVRPLLAVVGGGYVALTLSYTLLWRHIVILDLVAIAGGFVLRAVAGGVAAPVTLSRAFLLVISAVAVFVAAGKRHSELWRPGSESGSRRRVLESYRPWLIDLVFFGSAAVAVATYCFWSFQLPLIDGFPWRPLTILPFALCLIRYGARVQAGAGEAPEEVLLADRPLQVAAVAWLVVFALGVHAAG
jgi:decaprenyl-phosphate phosphoribosyltransferase